MDDFNLLDHIRNRDEQSVVVWLFNIGTEKVWKKGNSKGVSDKNENIIVNHIEEINLLITRRQDYIILRKKPNLEFLSDLIDYDMEIPNMLFPSVEDESKSISELVLADDKLIQDLSDIAKKQKVYFVPYGVSVYEEEIAKKSGMHLVGGTHEKSCIVNDKIFSKQISRDLNLPAAEDRVCSTLDEIKEAYEELKKKHSKIIIKMPCNSSGQGMWIVDSEKKLKTVCLIITRLMKDRKNEKWLVEGWIDHKIDLNIQIYVSESGYVDVFSVKEQIIDGTLYTGSVMPPRISKENYDCCVAYAKKIGTELYNKGYSGVFGIDALIDNDDRVVPIIEINGRFTLSTYLSFLLYKFHNKKIIAFYKRIKTQSDRHYSDLIDRMKDNSILFDGTEGVMVYNSATTNSDLAENHIRVFYVAIADKYDKAFYLSDKMSEICQEL